MVYKYREVECPWCGHRFMWQKNNHEGLVYHEYRLKDTKELVEKTKCPLCDMDMIVLAQVLQGIDLRDERIEIVGVRGRTLGTGLAVHFEK